VRLRLPERPVALFARNLVAALAALLPFKLALVACTAFGAEGETSAPALAAKSLLFFGNDVLGGALVALAATLVSWPFIALGRARAGAVAACALQALHGALVAVSFFTALYIGGPLNREVIELSSLVGGTNAEGAAGAPALWSSIAKYLGPWQLLALLAGIALPIAAYALAPRLLGRLSKRAKRALIAAAALEAALTALLLPWLINGEILGIRLHTFGLERSAGLVLAGSYAKPLLGSLARRGGAHPGDPFIFHFAPIAAPEEAPAGANPLRSAVPKRTNVILVSLESVGAVYSDAAADVMPFVRGEASRRGGVYLSRPYTVWPQTMKAFFSVFCSELPYPYYQSITAVNPAIPCVSLSEVLHAAGYRTALVSSADLAYDRKMRFFRHRAFDTAVDMHTMPGREGAWGDSWGIEEKVAVRHILDLAAQKRDEPLFVFYEMFTAHHPYNACREHELHPLDEYPSYLRALRYIDDRVRELADGIARLGLADDTLIAVFGDHGEAFGQHAGVRSHGPKVYDEVARVPAMLMGPQLKGASGDVSLPTSHVDLAPTILGLLGLDAPCTMKGRDLSRTSAERLVLFGGRPPGAQRGLVDGRWKYIQEEDGPEMLFDLEADRGERDNEISGHEAQAARYRAKLEDWHAYSENLIENYASVLASSGCKPRWEGR
jgi:hypothetical protein